MSKISATILGFCELDNVIHLSCYVVVQPPSAGKMRETGDKWSNPPHIRIESSVSGVAEMKSIKSRVQTPSICAWVKRD